jgi:DNA polymerase I-like protein with 3'-5' exonuclease and polymerase domains
MKLILDVENTTNTRGGKLHLDPYETGNKLVQVGFQDADDESLVHTVTLDHKERKDTSGLNRQFIQHVLEETTLLIMHNAQHDLMWLWECGFTYEGPIYDTMLAEYVLLRGQKMPLSLDACTERRELKHLKSDTLKNYFKEGYNTDEIPLKELNLYLRADLNATRELYWSIEEDYAKAEAESLCNVRDITFETCKTLTRMYMSGVRVDRDALDAVRKEFEQEKADLETHLQHEVRRLMGDTPINLGSPEQMSQVVFSRRMNNKKEWAGIFEHTRTAKEFKDAVAANSTIIKKTKAFTCPDCNGTAKTYKTKKDGTKYAKPNKCKACDARGYGLEKTNVLAGLGFAAPSAAWISANGFSTGKDNLDVLVATAKNNNMQDAIKFLESYKRLNAISSYLSTFVEGIDLFTKDDGLLHVGLTQHITATGRFSGRNPNMQNMPRGGTFPVKKVFVSRWDNGKIMEADFAQLEFRAAAFLSQDAMAMAEIESGFDVHSYTARVISEAGQPTSRQEAKAHTFAPLFGATGYGRSKAEEAYYIHFTEKYEGIAAWHKNLADEAIRFQKITNVSGRQYAFPDVKRNKRGGVSHFTMIKNYPVQGFATGDVVPVVLIELERRLWDFNSLLLNTVHDSTVVDIHPDEEQTVIQIIEEMNGGLNDLIEEAYGVKMNVPLLLESKVGPNWLEVVDV